MQKFSKEWFELADHRRRQFSRNVWVPIYGTQKPIEAGNYGMPGFEEELLAVGAVLIDSDKREVADRLG
ncbi:MAG: hypothetical protein ACU0CA_09960 [Paracoccaceae bacterium]